MNNCDMLIVFTTVPDPAQAEALASAMVSAKLAACVQILPPMNSVYVWEGEVQKEPENLLLIKTLPEKYKQLEAFILERHSYDIPEIVAIEPKNISLLYLQWMQQVMA
ncbi:MAG: divalent-cation tolerance protein CutA [Pyrinomonadaceae bacterium]